MFNNCKWIWRNGEYTKDEYSEFYFEFDSIGKTLLNISCDSDYAFYVNGTLAAFGQYADFPHYKIYDSIDITEFCKSGTNRCGIIVYYKGNESSSTYYSSTPGLIFEVLSDDKQVAKSDINILSRLSNSYTNGRCKRITLQLGYTFHYSINKEDNWLFGEINDFSPSVISNKNVNLFSRPNKKTKLLDRIPYSIVDEENKTRYIIDFGKEQVGFIDIELVSDVEQPLLVSYGEHLADGSVRRIIDSRDFSFSIDLKKGFNKYMNPFLRLGCRYIELLFESPVEIKYVGIRPVVYPTKIVDINLDERRKRIYDACIHTLMCCMHEHYEDCPWREQAMYTMDSRNQMLCGYYAFEEYEFPKACIKLIAESIMPDNFLPICHPCGTDLVIPSFNMHYFTLVREYAEYSKDVDFIKEIFPTLKGIIDNFISYLDNDLIPAFIGDNRWNFYEWTDGMFEEIGELNGKRMDLSINCLMISALKDMSFFCEIAGERDIYLELAKKMSVQVNKLFFDMEKGLYKNNDSSDKYSQLGNALAILSGVAGEKTKDIAEKIISSPILTKASLSMEFFIYDALLLADKEKYKSYVLNQLDEEYGYMLDNGATTFWETLDGEKAFDKAGSLCHGWSTAPIYYYNILIK